MNATKVGKLLDRIVEIVPPLVEARFERKDTCILSTALAIDILGHFRVKARPLVVHTTAMNAYVADCGFRGEVPFPLPDEYWTVALGHRLLNHIGPGHMVAVQGRTLIDLTIGQAARPKHGIDLPPAFHFRFREEPASSISRVGFADGSVVEYEPQPNNYSYLDCEWWYDRSFRRGIADQAISRILNRNIRSRGLVRSC